MPIGTDRASLDRLDRLDMMFTPPKMPIPVAVPKKLSMVSTNALFYDGTGHINPIFPETVYAMQRPLWTNAERVELFPSKLLRGRRLLYRGIANRDIFRTSLVAGMIPYWSGAGNEFGPGLYHTFDLRVAKGYTGPGGVILAIDWSDEGGALTKKYLSGEKWKEQVKAWGCIQTTYAGSTVAPEYWPEDFICGKVASNHCGLMKCQGPIPSTEEQVVARSHDACLHMAKKLVGVIYIQ